MLAAPFAPARAQITIGGNIYGGGNEGDVEGSTTVTIRTCEVTGNVFGGARMADVKGRTFVNIDGENATGSIEIKAVYGGNDIAGTVGASVDPTDTALDKVPSKLTEVLQAGQTKETNPEKNAINNSWNAFIRTSKMPVEDKDHRIVVGTIFGGGNGDYNYFKPGDVTGKDGDDNDIIATEYEVRDKATGDLIAQGTTAFTLPELDKTYLELLGGCLAHVYGGGNNATVKKATTLCINNTSLGLEHLMDPANLAAEFADLAQFVDLSTFQGNYASLDYTFARVFGGNNKATMTIMPTWNVQRGRIRDLYSGGNEGKMTSQYGLLVDIDPLKSYDPEDLYILNVYGGCRRANVDPLTDAGQIPTSIQLPQDETYSKYRFPAGLSARTIIRGGHIVNVYGGNDISGRVYGGDALGIYSTVYGDVYGGGNGSYSYTDNPELGKLNNFRDYYYNYEDVKEEAREWDYPDFEYSSTDPKIMSIEALSLIRPNAEQVSILVKGTDAAHPTIIRGALYLGGNSATLKRKRDLPEGTDPLVELKIGSHAIVDKVFLGDNGENMVTENIMELYAGNVNAEGEIDPLHPYKFNQIDLTDEATFAQYMNGCAMELKPRVVFEQEPRDPQTYIQHSSMFGSFYCGGNRGSMVWPGTNTINFDKEVIIYDKFVGGCNNANIDARPGLNAAYNGGMIGAPAEQGPMGMKNPDGSIKDCLILNLSGLKIQPKRWVDDNDPSQGLEWNTYCYTDGADVDAPALSGDKTINRDNPADQHDFDRRLRGGNIYGGCYESGHMNGNVVINLLDDIIEEDKIFDQVTKDSYIFYENDKYTITKRNSGVILDEQGMDPLAMSMNVFGAGYGKDSEVWGSTTVNLRKGFTFQIFGGGQEGVVGQPRESFTGTDLATIQPTDYVFNGKHYFYDPRFSTYINMDDDEDIPGNVTNDVACAVFLYGGSYQAPIAGNTRINLGDGRIFNSFAGSCNADILGHTETYVGNGIAKDGSLIQGFPYVVDHIYGGNDLGGRILAEKETGANGADCDFTDRVSDNGQDLTKIYQYDASSNPTPGQLTASAYIEYTQGHIASIFGGSFGDYDYTDVKYRDYCNEDGSSKEGFYKPRLGNAFINFKPASSSNELNTVAQVYGAGQGRHYVIDRDVMQERSYLLVDIPQTMIQFENTVFFGAGAYGGLGMEPTPAYAQANPERVSAIIDLLRGQVKNVYGGSFNEGITRRTVVNVPAGSTLTAQNIFGGAYGSDNRYPCDVYESNVNYNTETEITGGIYGGNNHARRTLYTNVNINGYLWSDRGKYEGYVYGAGRGEDTWAEYTNVNVGEGGVVYKVFGGGDAGQVLNEASLQRKKALAEAETDPDKKGLDLDLSAYTNKYLEEYITQYGELALDIEAKRTRDYYHKKEKYNTNVHILPGAHVTGYAYGGGYGATATVSGTTYIDLLGGIVDRDIYGGGQGGSVHDLYGLKTFTATTNAYIKGGMARNIYGGGYLGAVGYHEGKITDATTNDVLGSTNVVIGVLPEKLEANPKAPGDEGYDPDYHFYNGQPAITRNAFGSGEGGSIFGTSHLTVNNGYVGYRYTPSVSDDATTTTFDERYVEELDDPGQGEAAAKDAIKGAGNAFGGGYIANAYADSTYLAMYGGHLRGNMYGGGELGPVGRGTKLDASGNVMDMPTIAKGGATHVYLYNGHVHRNVFGGGRGYDSWGGDGTKYMSAEQIANSDFNTKGYIFGSTDVHVRGGIVGTPEGVRDGLDGDGNVFGGGDLGYVYSALGQKKGTRGEALSTSNGLPVNGGGYYYKGGDISQGMTVDCNVDVAPSCQVKAGMSITLPELQTNADGTFVRATSGEGIGYPIKTGNTITFNEYEYVPVEYLDLLNKGGGTYGSSVWDKIDYQSGITIHNAVFAGGNVSVGSDQVFVNSNTVYGNVTAALRDAYHRDLITIGTEHIGGLYGDGNLTFVDGFRELTVNNYGTDFYSLSEKISIDDYHKLGDRERAYFRLEYECQQTCQDKNGKEYTSGATLTQEEYNELFEGTTIFNDTNYWKEAGFCSIYAGRLLNTLQRADFIGVWGSRMVLQGARDRVPEKADYTNYTLNRVGEVSLNCIKTQCSEDVSSEDAQHGNYFGIYSVVNYLGNLTSDVDFHTDIRYTKHSDPVGVGNKADVDGKPYGTATYYDWKKGHVNQKNRNNGSCDNMVALASGVYLELINETTEKRTDGLKDWGYITGVVELDLISVMQGLGGGYVYAKNEHGTSTHHDTWDKVTLSPYNRYAVTYKRYTYAEPTSTDETETSGNFIHYTKQIVDDCYPVANSFYGPDAQAAHYWYIKGSVYVYDQYISAYTGSATAYLKNISLPLTISANAHGKLELTEVQPNLYAYYADTEKTTRMGDNGSEDNFVVNNVTYRLNDPITYWDYEQLTEEDKKHFVSKTYTVIDSCMIDGQLYPKGYTMLQEEYDAFSASPEVKIWDSTDNDWAVDAKGIKDFAYMVRLSNNLSHDTGYILTYAMDNPLDWNEYYTKDDLSDKLSAKDYKDGGEPASYKVGPTYRLKDATAGVFGQREYIKGDIIDNNVQSVYAAIPAANLPSGQATFETAYVVNQDLIVTDDNGDEHHISTGVAIAQSDYTNSWSTISSKVSPALIITSTLELTPTEFLYAGDLYSEAQLKAYIKQATGKTDAEVDEFYANNSSYYSEAFCCTEPGKYGGDLYTPGVAYEAIKAWSAMSQEDREHFTFNYDALDLLIDPEYQNIIERYDGTNVPKFYSKVQPVEYKARLTGDTSISYTNAAGATVTITDAQELTRDEYEAIPNERYHYAPINVTKTDSTYYVVKTAFIRGDMPYTIGQSISEQLYNSLTSEQKDRVETLTFPASIAAGASESSPKIFYYCRDSYKVNENGEGQPVTNVFNTSNTITTNNQVPLGFIINEANYAALPNKTVDDTQNKMLFTIYGNMPVETSTLFVSRESDILDLSKEKTITVIINYNYEESDEAGMHIVPITERHIVNIHLQFKSGVPEIGELSKPNTILPGTTVGLRVPDITPGAFEVLGNGWEIFTNSSDAASHKNGQPYVNNDTKMYWYQDGYYVAYYAKTYLGKTYSNAVEFDVANYHDLDKVMQDKEHHYYLDHKDAHRQRDPKVYIDNRECTSDASKNELDLLKDFFELTLHDKQYNAAEESLPIATTGALAGHHGVDVNYIGAAKNLQFYLRSDMTPKAYTDWQSIGDATNCFEGSLHGDGYTISGLNHSLFEELCGEVYNLGVTGSFTEAGIVNTGTGYVENCWIMSSATSGFPADTKAVFGNPSDTKGTQIVNCYYPETNAYSETEHARGNARKMPLKAFYDGEVTYDLNGFYLNKRYFDQALQPTGNKAYGFWRAAGDGSLPTEPETEYYTPAYAIYPLVAGRDGDQAFGYVEDRYDDGDFIYAGGSIPEDRDQRLNTADGKYYPIWPDDYLFFGQRLTYGYVDGRPHQDTPTHINKTSTRLTHISTDVNRVFRAPAYFQSSVMGVAHYNPYAVFAPYKNGDPTTLAYKNMTAIDFTGYNGDVTDYPTVTTADYKQGLCASPSTTGPEVFFPPLLDNDGLEALRNFGLTRNWLVYTPDAIDGDANAADSKTNNIVLDYLKDPVYTETNATYRTVATRDTQEIHGHAVVKKGTDTYTALGNHFLVDKQDFNAPTSYTFAAGQRMWYQRRPETYVDRSTGWEGISIPFTAEVVTTQQKGEITHFYGNSQNSLNGTNTKRGHEYWLREFQGGALSTTDPDVFVADFAYPTTSGTVPATLKDKEYTNTFLWDYYYRESGAPRQDHNTDTYQQDYYATTQTHADYAYSTIARPYIIGFPGTTYYEFDLSGEWQAHVPLNAISKLAQQTITFASPESTTESPVTIAVSDNEMTTATVTAGNYAFRPNYLTKDIEASAYILNSNTYAAVANGTTLTSGKTYYTSDAGAGQFTSAGTEVADGTNYYELTAAAGSSYVATATATAGVPFRPYFTAVSGGGGVKGDRRLAQRITFSNLGSDEEQTEPADRLDGDLIVKGKRGRILVTSAYDSDTTVHIVNAAGALIRIFTLAPGETIETNVPAGVYIVNKKKISIK